MSPEVEKLSAELRDELAANNVRRLKDPREQAVRHHHLKAMGRSPAHCLASFQDDESRESLALRIGKGAHAMMFGQEVTRYPGKVRRGKDWEAFKAVHPHAVILSAKEYLQAQNIATSLRSHPEASRLLFPKGIIHERTILWTQDGRKRRTTPDARLPGQFIAELKTADNSEPNAFQRKAIWYGYHAQMADQRAAVEAETGQRLPCFIVAVEKKAPFTVTVHRLSERTLEKGDRINRLWFERLRVCEQTMSWPGYSEAVVDFDIPDEEELGLIFGDEEGGDEHADDE